MAEFEKPRGGRKRFRSGDRVVWLAGAMIAIGAIMCFAALLNF